LVVTALLATNISIRFRPDPMWVYLDVRLTDGAGAATTMCTWRRRPEEREEPATETAAAAAAAEETG
jgi:hypothetical protein